MASLAVKGLMHGIWPMQDLGKIQYKPTYSGGTSLIMSIHYIAQCI